jgi:hypothetical protein
MRTHPSARGGRRHALALLSLIVIAPLAPLAPIAGAQQTTREETISWASASSAEDGFLHGTARLRWRPSICSGDLRIVYGLVRGSARGYEGYWYKGVNYGLRSDFQAPQQPAGTFSVRVMIGAQEVKSLQIVNPPAGGSAGCMGSGFFVTAGPVKDFLPPRATEADREALLDRVSFDFSVSTAPMRSDAVERTIRDEIYAATMKARRDSMDKARVARAQRDSAERAQRALAQQQRRDSTERARTMREQPASRERAASRGTSANTPSNAAPAATSATPRTAAESRAAREQRTREAAAQQQAERAAEAERVRAAIQAQQEEQAAAAKLREEQITEGVAGIAAAAQGLGASFGGYYLAMDEAPRGSSSYTFQALSGFGVGMSWRYVYADAGMVNATFTDNFVASETGVEKESSGYFMSGGLVLDLPASPSFSFGPSLGYTTVETPDASTSGIHAGFVIRMGGLKIRADMGSAEQNFYGIGAYLKF